MTRLSSPCALLTKLYRCTRSTPGSGGHAILEDHVVPPTSCMYTGYLITQANYFSEACNDQRHAISVKLCLVNFSQNQKDLVVLSRQCCLFCLLKS